MDNSAHYLFLASGVKNGEGFWIVGVKNCNENVLEDKTLLDCHRKELIGYQSAKDILFAIKLNIDNLLHELRNKNYLIENPSMGCLLYTSPSPRDRISSRMPSSA